MSTSDPPARVVGLNHVALEVGDIEQALAFYGSLFALTMRGREGDSMAFVDLGDQVRRSCRAALRAARRRPSLRTGR